MGNLEIICKNKPNEADFLIICNLKKLFQALFLVNRFYKLSIININA